MARPPDEALSDWSLFSGPYWTDESPGKVMR
jgi:hypothetical protein